MENKDELIKIFSRKIREILANASLNFDKVQEIRLRVQAPLLLVMDNREYYVTENGRLSSQRKEAYVVSQEELKETMEHISRHSLYAFEEEVKQGFLTIQGGHRIGLAGKAILDERGIRTIKYRPPRRHL